MYNTLKVDPTDRTCRNLTELASAKPMFALASYRPPASYHQMIYTKDILMLTSLFLVLMLILSQKITRARTDSIGSVGFIILRHWEKRKFWKYKQYLIQALFFMERVIE